MNERRTSLQVVLVAILVTVVLSSAWAGEINTLDPQGMELTALDEYVRAPDPNYSFELLHSVEAEGVTGYILSLTSQQWLTEEEVDRPIWQHILQIIRPHHTTTDTGLLVIGGGRNGKEPPTQPSEMAFQLAVGSQSVVAELGMVPNQPITFAGEEEPRWEDSLIAYTWDKYLRTGDDKWPARLPMTKAAVRAMDTITDFCASEAGGGIPVTKFVVAGGSKRGWTTWTTAAVDPRVVAICPIVIDLLNVVPSFVHHFEAYGKYAPAVGDYEHMNIMSWMGSKEYQHLLAIVEPYSYRKRLTLPKFLLNSTGDQFFLPDSAQFYWEDLQGEKYLRYVPNTDHGLDDSDALESLLSWYHGIVHNVPRPRFNWDVQDNLAIKVLVLDKPESVLLWQATNPETRDFRKDIIGAVWSSEELPDLGGGIYLASVEPPEKGWTAYFVELTYASGISVPYKFTTQVVVTPEERPFHYEMPSPSDHAPGFLSK